MGVLVKVLVKAGVLVTVGVLPPGVLVQVKVGVGVGVLQLVEKAMLA